MALTADEAEFLIKAIISEEQQRLQTLLQPYFKELVDIEARKPARPIAGPDGRMFVYCGPTADDIAGPYQAPSWLGDLARDGAFAGRLARYRALYAHAAAEPKDTTPCPRCGEMRHPTDRPDGCRDPGCP